MTRATTFAALACTLALGAGVAAQTIHINGAGATFPNPMSGWRSGSLRSAARGTHFCTLRSAIRVQQAFYWAMPRFPE